MGNGQLIDLVDRFCTALCRRVRRALWHKLHIVALGAVIALGGSTCSETGPIYPTPDHLEPWVYQPDAVLPGSDTAPELRDPVARFTLARGHRRTGLRAGHRWGTEQTYLFSFDIRLNGPLPAHPLALSRIVRRGASETRILEVLLDARRGVTVLGRSCVPRDSLGHWHSVQIRLAMADTDTGFLEIFCDEKPIWARSHMRTTWPPVCRAAEGCTRPLPAPADFEWQVGLISPRRVARQLSVDMRRVTYHRLFYIPHRVPDM